MTQSSLSISSVYFILHNLMIKHFSPYKASSIFWFQARGPPITILVLNENIHRYVPKVQCHAKAKCHALENRNPCLSLWQRCEDTELCAHTSVKLKKRPMPPTNLKTSPAYFPIIGAQGEHGWLLFTQLAGQVSFGLKLRNPQQFKFLWMSFLALAVLFQPTSRSWP